MRTRRTALLVSVLMLAGCDYVIDTVDQPGVVGITDEQASDARRAAERWLGDSGQAVAICGQADGLAVYTHEWDKNFISDGMKDGRTIFVDLGTGDYDVVFRDATGKFFSAIEEGGSVARLYDPDGEFDSWVVTYKSTGVTETHNLTSLTGGKLVDLWTSNKPSSTIFASAKLFRSSCVRA